MDLKYHHHPPPLISSSHGVKGQGVAGVRKENGKRNVVVVEAPPTPGRPVFSFTVVGNNNNNNVSRKNLVPSKWNDAQKWLNHSTKKSSSTTSTSNGFGIKQHHHTKEEKVQKALVSNSPRPSSHVLKDKFTNKFQCSEPLSERFLPSMVDGGSRDIGTEMTPLGSSTTSRCPTPFKTLSPPRHNTPATRSGPLDPGSSLDIQECHLAKLKLDSNSNSNWSSREEEDEDISKSLRHFEMSYECRKSISEPRGASVWEEEEEKTKSCLRYQREEAKIQAWVDLQNAKAEAQSRKLEVKIQKMRSKFEEKVMRKMAIVHRKAEEVRAAAQLEHSEQIQKASEQAKKTMNLQLSMHSTSCGCFPCNNLHP